MSKGNQTIYIICNDFESKYVTTVSQTIDKEPDHVVENGFIGEVPFLDLSCEDKVYKYTIPEGTETVYIGIRSGYRGPYDEFKEAFISVKKEDLMEEASILFDTEHNQEDECNPCTCKEEVMNKLEKTDSCEILGTYYECGFDIIPMEIVDKRTIKKTHTL